MKKYVNGKIVNIENIQLFEMAQESAYSNNMALNVTDIELGDDIKSELVNKLIKTYNMFISALPYPMYAIESNLKYATIASFIQFTNRDIYDAWVDKAIFARVDYTTGLTIKIVGNTWGIEYNSSDRHDMVDISKYSNQPGYNEYKWILDKATHKNNDTRNFYEKFMPEFWLACKNNQSILRYELENILIFSNSPEKLELQSNKILDFDNNKEYTFDIYFTGRSDTDLKIKTICLDGRPSVVERTKQINTYAFDLYRKAIKDTGIKLSKQIKCNLVAANNIFYTLCGIKTVDNLAKFPEFKAVINGDKLAFIINNRLFVGNSKKLCEPQEIARDVAIYNFDSTKLYYMKQIKINNSSNTKNVIYSYDYIDKKTRISKIYFE